MYNLKKCLFLILLCLPFLAEAQLLKKGAETFGRADSLRGYLSPLRSCYDVLYYHLDVKADLNNRQISGSNLFVFGAVNTFRELQFDLFENMPVDKVLYHGKTLPYRREYNAVFITFPEDIKTAATDSFRVFYHGQPLEAKNAPWDGGFVYSKDPGGKQWVSTACQGLGASMWWPTKDHQSDEPDSMLISVSVPGGLQDVSNGRLRKTTKLKNGYTRFDWFVSNPINNYNVSLNIGDYTHIRDSYQGKNGQLDLDYWVLPVNEAKARKQFDEDVKPMLRSFEDWFGPYPFYKDGYKLVETPFLGMEHQSAIAYGNGYNKGYMGRDLSGTGWGLKWDFIVVHESGHEWFGNNLTAKDIADMWVHESFTHYSESLFIESLYGKQAGQEYVHGIRKAVQNDAPVTGIYDVNKEGSGDMYYKGSVLLNMIRTIINDDQKWKSILQGLNRTFYHKTVTYKEVTGYISDQSGIDLSKVFEQYLRYKSIPTLELRTGKDKLWYRWIADVPGFDMQVRVRLREGKYIVIKPGDSFSEMELPGVNRDNIEVDTFNFYIGVLME